MSEEHELSRMPPSPGNMVENDDEDGEWQDGRSLRVHKRTLVKLDTLLLPFLALLFLFNSLDKSNVGADETESDKRPTRHG